jgi:putative peptidoglycan lipid II flippase
MSATPTDSPQPAGAAMRTERTSGVVRASGTMAIATLASRFTGFVAKVVVLAFLGAWIVSDSYNLANTLPNIIFELLIGGVLTSVAIPLLSRAKNDPDGGTAYTQRLMTLAIVALAVATGAALATAPWLIRLYQSGDGHADPVMATQLAYLLLPQIFFYGLAALFGAILNTDERFAAPAWAPVINNVVVIGVGAVLLATPGGFADPSGMAELSRGQFLLLGGGTTAGIVLQAMVMLPSLRRAGFRFRWRFGLDSRMYEAGRLMGWAIAYTLISQAGYIVTARIAFASRDGFYTLYTYGSMLFQLPYGILGVSLLTAIMPRMSRHAAAGDMDLVKRDMGLANRLSAVALLPVTAAMIALAVPLAVVTARYGRVTDDAAHILAMTLAAFAIGLLPLAITLVQMRVFYAMKDGRTPTIINAIMVAVRIPLLLAAAALPTEWVVPGLAAAMSVSYMVGVVVGEVWLHARFGSMGFTATLSTIARTALASAAGGVAAWWVAARLLPDSHSLGGAIGQLLVGGLVGLLVAGGAMLLLRIPEVDALRRRLASRVRPESPAWNDGTVSAEPDGQVHRQAQGQESVTEQHSEARGGSLGGDGPAAGDRHPTGDQRGVGDRPAGDRPAASASRPGVFFTPGMVVGERYRLSRRVAYDAVGNEFWLARDTVLPRDMAVTLLPATDPTASAVTHTLRVGRLHHSGLPQLLDMGAAGTASYLAGQWVDGATLVDLLTDGRLEGAIVARLTAGIADAVAEVHRAGFALGAIHPSLVRVGLDGRVRLSHVIARPNASNDDDVRAVGALTYLMLTGTWPLDDAGGPDDIPAAPRRGASEVPAAKVVTGVPPLLSKLASDALRGRGITIEEIAATARSFVDETAPGGRSRGGGLVDTPDELQTAPAPSAARPRRQRAGGGASAAPAAATVPDPVRRDRRLKLTIAGVMLTVLSVLIVIMGSSVVKQVLANIVAPIEAADQQELITVAPQTTTRTVSATGSSTPGSSGSTATASTIPVAVAGAAVYDPQGEPPADYESYVDRAFDGDLGTYWPTWVYKQQFGPRGLKDGVGLMLSFEQPVTPRAVTLSTTTPGTKVEVRSAASPTAALDSTTVLGAATLGTDPVTITLSNAPESKNLVVWITQLAEYQGDTPANKGQFQSTISEIRITR